MSSEHGQTRSSLLVSSPTSNRTSTAHTTDAKGMTTIIQARKKTYTKRKKGIVQERKKTCKKNNGTTRRPIATSHGDGECL